MRIISLGALTLLLTSCSTYRSYFDCAAPSGAGCQPVSQIEAQIVEHQDGEDCYCGSCSRHYSPPLLSDKIQIPELNEEEMRKRVWICPQENRKGHLVEGHYVYFGLEDSENMTLLIERLE